MKNFTKTLIHYINQVHSYPFWLFLFFLYSSICVFSLSILFYWYPQLTTKTMEEMIRQGVMWESAFGLFVIGCITAPIMDIILHVDIDKQ